jgi:hypothetical protein
MNKCAEQLGALACSSLEQAATKGTIDWGAVGQAMAESKAGESSDFVQFLLSAKDLAVCAAGYLGN